MALDRIPAGAEVTMSYLPVTEPLARRRRRLRHTFGFDRARARCLLETEWAKQDGDRVGDVAEETRALGGRVSAMDDAFLDALANEMDDEDARLAGISPQELERRSDRYRRSTPCGSRATPALCLECGGTPRRRTKPRRT